MKRSATSVRMAGAGFSLLEVLCAIFIVALVIGGALLYQSEAVALSTDASHRKAAMRLVLQIAERMRANQLAYRDGVFNVELQPDATLAAPAGLSCGGAVCSPDAAASADVASWQSDVRRQLPGSGVYIAPVGATTSASAPMSSVSIAWLEPTPQNASTSASDPNVGLSCTVNGAQLPGTNNLHRCITAYVYP